MTEEAKERREAQVREHLDSAWLGSAKWMDDVANGRVEATNIDRATVAGHVARALGKNLHRVEVGTVTHRIPYVGLLDGQVNHDPTPVGTEPRPALPEPRPEPTPPAASPAPSASEPEIEAPPAPPRPAWMDDDWND